MRTCLLSSALFALPMMSWAQDVPVYQQEGNNLIYTGETMPLEEAIKITGLTSANFAFDPPTFMANNRGTYIPVFAEPWEYEFVLMADGIIEGAPSDIRGDLVFDESEGLDVRDGLTFEESEGLDVRDGLTFDENEGLDVRDGLTFNESEGLNTRDGLTFEENEGTDTRESMSFDESEGLNTRDDLTFAESEGTVVADDAATSAQTEGVPKGLLKGAYGSKVTPQDGVWNVLILEAVAVGCPPGANEQAKAQILKTRDLNVTFSKPDWHPSDLSSELANYTWTKIGQNGYFSYPYTTSEVDRGSGISLAVSAAYFVRTETKIETWYRVRVNLAPHLAAIARSSENCEVEVLGELTK